MFWGKPEKSRAEMWAEEEALSLDERRQRYRCGSNFLTLDNIPTWADILQDQFGSDGTDESEDSPLDVDDKSDEKPTQEEAQDSHSVLPEAESEEKNIPSEDAPIIEDGTTPTSCKTEECTKDSDGHEQQANSEAEVDEEAVRETPKSDPAQKKSLPVATDDQGEDANNNSEPQKEDQSEEAEGDEEEPEFVAFFPPDAELNKIVSPWRGDITKLEIDAVVNAANRGMLGGGGIDGAIHNAAGRNLRLENMHHGGCNTGDCKISRGYKLPAKYVLSTVGPIGQRPSALASCYRRVLEVAIEHGVRSLAYCCVSTGIFGYPNKNAAHIALKVVRDFLQDPENRKYFDRIIFCLFMAVDVRIYDELLPYYFPPVGTKYAEPSEEMKYALWKDYDLPADDSDEESEDAEGGQESEEEQGEENQEDNEQLEREEEKVGGNADVGAATQDEEGEQVHNAKADKEDKVESEENREQENNGENDESPTERCKASKTPEAGAGSDSQNPEEASEVTSSATNEEK